MRRDPLLAPLHLLLLLAALGCESALDGPIPSLTGLDPSLVCVEQLETTITISGEALSPLALDAATAEPKLAIPSVALRRVTDLAGAPVSGPAVTLPNDPADPSTARVAWTSERSMTFTVSPALGLPPGSYEVTVTNPSGASATLAAALTTAPRPTLTAAEPDLFCVADGSRGITLTGDGFLDVGGVLPEVTVGAISLPVDMLDGCVALPGPAPARTCASAHVTIPPSISSGAHDVVLINPAPAGCTSTDSVSVLVVSPPTVNSVAPAAICLASPPTEMAATGSGFIVFRGAPDLFPEVVVDGAPQTVSAAGGCSPLPGAGVGVDTCSSLTFSLPTLAAGSHSLGITNPDPAGCSTTLTTAFDVAPPPVLSHVEPMQVCASGGTFAVVATDAANGFASGATVKLRPSGSVGGFSAVDSSAFVDATRVTGTFSALASGLYDVTVENGAVCEATPLLGALDLVAAPFVYFADPPSIYDGVDLTVTIYVAGGTGALQSVTAVPAAGGAAVPLAITDASQPGRVQVLVPAGALGAGLHDVVVTDGLSCGGLLASGLEVTSSLTVAVAAISPPFGWTGDRIPVAITATATPPAGMTGFVSTPRVYLSPRTAGGVATEIRVVTYLDGGRLSGTIPAGLPVDRYDLVVVNPDGAVGLLPDAFGVLAEPPPVVDSLLPGSVPSQDDMVVTVTGSGFDPDATASASCRWVDDVLGVRTASLSAAVTFVDASTLTTAWDLASDGVPIGAVCVLRVANPGDGTWADFSALSVTPASNTPNDFAASNALNVGRRALAGAALRMNAVDRFVFAIGGDNGLTAAAYGDFASVEAARVDPYGVVEPWVLQRNPLPAARSFTTAATVGRFVYLPGGKVAGVETQSVLRAYLLDPAEAPAISGLDLALDDALGLDSGLWIYRVAALLDASDPTNPGGEGLASEPVTLRIPQVAGTRVQLNLFWSAVPNAVAYRVYRTPTANGAAGEERLLAEIPAVVGTQRYTDDGSVAVAAGAPPPLPLGSLGVWHPVADLVTARQGAAVVAVPDPNDAATTYLHVLGGLAGGVALSSAERATITTTAQNAQSIGPFTEVAAVLPDARWQTAAVHVDRTQAPVVAATDAWIYLLPGLSAEGGAVSHVTAFKIDAADGVGSDDGRLGAGIEVDSPVASAGGYGAVARNGFLYILAGAGTADSAGKAAEICTATGAGCATVPPDLVMWNAGIQMKEGRVLNGTASESGFVFVFGGQTETSAATTTAESTNI